MERMFIITNHKDLHQALGAVHVKFSNTEDEYNNLMRYVDCILARGDFIKEIPSAECVEMFIRRSSLTGPGENGNDFVFENAWGSPRSREAALAEMYKWAGSLHSEGVIGEFTT